MNGDFNHPERFLVEVSGWCLDNSFFVEKAELVWQSSGEKKVVLHHALPEGAMIFVRLQGAAFPSSPLPVPYQVSGVRPMDCKGQCELNLTQLHPRPKVSNENPVASNLQEDSKTCETKESMMEFETQEVLR